MAQEYSAKNFARCFKKSDIQRFKLTGVDVYEYLQSQSEKCSESGYIIDELKISKDKKIHYVDPELPHEHLMVRHCSKVLQDLHSVNFPDRKKMISFIKNILIESLNTGDTSIHKFDLKSFYESIKKDNIQDIINDSRLHNNIRETISSIYKNKNKLVRGVSLTAVIAEKYMYYFDQKIKLNPEVLYYFRYVDDIFIITRKAVNENVIKELVTLSLPVGLSVNEKKHSYIIIKNHEFEKFTINKSSYAGVYFSPKSNKIVSLDFLGYKFILSSNNNKVKLETGISESKKSNIKRKIIRSFFRFKIEKDFELLFLRINYLCSNVRILSSRKLYSGVYYNYSLIDFDYDNKSGVGFNDLLDIHKFLQSIIHGRNKHPSLSGINLSEAQKNRLKKISILSGFKDKRVLKLSNEKISKIKGAWFNV